ncbi:hypothetical protein V1517DRAFT_32146 [Lipomyces orientalis]|uniref:Uncharacterized protein n=1 Tax=Lipomyces orientalis TaxID=1233043 RepID=A0ACC3TFS3_9ASCO
MDSAVFRSVLTEHLIGKQGNSLVAVFFRRVPHRTGALGLSPQFPDNYSPNKSLHPCRFLLSATVPPSKVQQIRKVYNRPDMRLIRAPSTMRLNITYDVVRASDKCLKDNLRAKAVRFLENRRRADRALAFVCQLPQQRTCTITSQSNWTTYTITMAKLRQRKRPM